MSPLHITTTLEEYEMLCKTQVAYGELMEKHNTLIARYNQLLASWDAFHTAYTKLKLNYNAMIGGGELGKVD